MNRAEKRFPKKSGKKALLLMEALVLASIISVAFFIPQILFYVKDIILYRDIELSERESMDLEALSGNYERSLYQRMLNFASGLEAGDNFYVTSRDLVVNQELEDFLFSSSGLYQEMMFLIYNADILPSPALAFDDYQSAATKWKQYVIYSDNYTKGVNFILWYIELKSEADFTLKILVDAQTGTFYALKLEGCEWMDSYYITEKFDNLFLEDNLDSMWYFCALYYEAFSSEEDLLKHIAGNYGSDADNGKVVGIRIVDGQMEGLDFPRESDRIPADRSTDENNWRVTDEMVREFFSERAVYEPMENQAIFSLPYEGNSLNILLKLEEWRSEVKKMVYMYPDMIFGVRQIYEMIPEFL